MGPSLVDRHAHHDIHDAARADVEAGTELLHASLGSQDNATTVRLARELANGWRQRVLAHADAEEQDVFPQVVEHLPEQRAAVAALIRDHQLMRLLVAEVEQELLRKERVTRAVLDRFAALLHVQRLHSVFEEENFLPQISGALSPARQRSKEGPKPWPNA